MAKLYPPTLPNSIPAVKNASNGEPIICIPLKLNPTVSYSDITSWSIKIWPVSGNSASPIYNKTLGTATYKRDKNYLYFSTKDLKDNPNFMPKEHYKVQISNNKGTERGFMSNAAIFKYVGNVSASMELGDNQVNFNNKIFIGKYQHLDDFTEKPYSYQFKIYDSLGKIVQDSGELFHKEHSRDDSYNSFDEYELLEDLPENEIFEIQYIIKTINGLELKSRFYKIQSKYFLAAEYNFKLIPNIDNENGVVNIKVDWAIEDNKLIEGYFRLMRFDRMRKIWFEIDKIELVTAYPASLNFIDNTVEDGHIYYYALQQYTINEETEQINIISDYFGQTDDILVSLEHCYLADGQKQLKIAFNPQISSLKTNILETRTNTIGSKYPYFYKNGQVSYKEFPISGLISHLTDENNLFTIDKAFVEKNNRFSTPGLSQTTNFLTNLTSDNFYQEQQFKMEVLDWLNNGEIKLFRSAAEGTYLVRLTNVSLSPNTQLGRMLHTFSATAVEVADLNYKNLNNLGFFHKINGVVKNAPSLEFWRSVPNIEFETMEEGRTNLIPYSTHTQTILGIRLEDFMPGDIFKLVLPDGEIDVVINKTGSYYYNNPVKKVIFMGNQNFLSRPWSEGGILTYRLRAYTTAIFKHIESYDQFLVPYQQILGETYPKDTKDNTYTQNIMEHIENIKHNTKFNFLRFYIDDFLCPNGTNTKIKLKPKGQGEVAEIDLNIDNLAQVQEKFKNINLYITDKIHFYEITGVEEFETIQLGDKVVAEVSYNLFTKKYSLEDTNMNLTNLNGLIQSYKKLINYIPYITTQTVLDGINIETYQTNYRIPKNDNENYYYGRNINRLLTIDYRYVNYYNRYFISNILKELHPTEDDVRSTYYIQPLRQAHNLINSSKITIEKAQQATQILLDYLEDLYIQYLTFKLKELNDGEAEKEEINK